MFYIHNTEIKIFYNYFLQNKQFCKSIGCWLWPDGHLLACRISQVSGGRQLAGGGSHPHMRPISISACLTAAHNDKNKIW